MSQKWNLQDIKPAQTRKRRTLRDDVTNVMPDRIEKLQKDEVEVEPRTKNSGGNQKRKRSLIYGILIFVFVVCGGIVVSSLMGGAEIKVYPTHREPTVNAVLEAKKMPQSDELSYEVMTLEAVGERQVAASGEEHVTSQAVGTISIYNNVQQEPLRLVTNTRFESPSGLIYKIKDSAIVPGYTLDESDNKIPGVTTAEVYADQVGEEYNIAPSRFTVPGFKGDPEYENIYGESNESFTGGYNGAKFIINDTELQTAQQALRTELRNSLLARIDEEKPAGFVLFKDAVTFTYVSLPSVAYGENLATIKEKVVLRVPLFKEDIFAQFIAKATLPGYEGDSVRISNYDTFTFQYTSATTSSSDISNYTSISFNLTGSPQVIWTYDSDKLKTDLLNLNKSALTSVLSGYPAIERANATIRPFWKTKFPATIDDIKITEVIELAE